MTATANWEERCGDVYEACQAFQPPLAAFRDKQAGAERISHFDLVRRRVLHLPDRV
jgi:hypothetical protein